MRKATPGVEPGRAFACGTAPHTHLCLEENFDAQVPLAKAFRKIKQDDVRDDDVTRTFMVIIFVCYYFFIYIGMNILRYSPTYV